LIGSALAPAEQAQLERGLEPARSTLGPDDASAQYAAGLAMTFDETVDEAARSRARRREAVKPLQASEAQSGAPSRAPHFTCSVFSSVLGAAPEFPYRQWMTGGSVR